MKILIIDTCGAAGSVALAVTGDEPGIAAAANFPGRSASERLVFEIKELMERCEATLDSLGAVAVVNGPGSFTGVRVGMSAAKGLCEALGLPLIAISRLAVLAEAGAGSGGRVLALLDAGRGEFYLGEYGERVQLREGLATRGQVLAVAEVGKGEDLRVVTCEPAVAGALAEIAVFLIEEPCAGDALALVMRRVEADDYDDVATVDANYLRRTDAEIFAKPNAARQPGISVS